MSETPSGVAPATDANRDYEQFVPQSTRDNYAQMARDAAAINGTSPTSELRSMAGSFEGQHKADPTGGWDHLAAWARQADANEGQAPDPVAVARAKAVESARRDPKPALLAADPEVAAAAVEALEAQAAASNTASIDNGSGVVPNTGPLTVDVPSSAERADGGGEVTADAPPAAESTDSPTVSHDQAVVTDSSTGETHTGVLPTSLAVEGSGAAHGDDSGHDAASSD